MANPGLPKNVPSRETPVVLGSSDEILPTVRSAPGLEGMNSLGDFGVDFFAVPQVGGETTLSTLGGQSNHQPSTISQLRCECCEGEERLQLTYL